MRFRAFARALALTSALALTAISETGAAQGRRANAEINRRLGDPDYPATPVVDAWLARIFR